MHEMDPRMAAPDGAPIAASEPALRRTPSVHPPPETGRVGVFPKAAVRRAAGLRSISIAGVIRLVPLDERGRQIIEELEEKAREQPTEIQEDGGRLYHV